MSKFIKVRGISKSYKHINLKKYIQVLNDINFDVFPQESIAILGKNGSGKSTLLKVLCGSLQPSGGVINISGTISWPVGFGGGFDGNLSARDNIKFISSMMGYGPHKSLELQNLVEFHGNLEGKLDYLVKNYSSGMKARLFFFTSIIFRFDFYLFDEITAVGDQSFENSSQSIMDFLREKSGLIVVSHNTKKVRQHCDYGYILNDGKLSPRMSIDEATELYEEL